MDKAKHTAWQWHPPKRTNAGNEAFATHKDVQSATECTGLIQQVPENESEAYALSGLYGIHVVKPQGNVGKCNPNNDPGEIAFHRQ